ncbi:MAG TPA: hypothetical protein VHO48_00660 [Anaerolineaceae bacterium]|nr:hypothetical protein [Anaerolineaceae bacterium]
MPITRTRNPLHRIFIPALLAGALLAGCSRGTPNAATPGSSTADPSAQASSAAATLTPTETPAPSAAVVLLAPPEADPGQVEGLRAALGELTGAASLSFAESPTVDASSIGPTTQIVIGAPGVDLSGLAAAAAQTRFVSFGAAPQNAPQNLVSIALPVEHEAFMAGYTAALVTFEWRVGVITRPDAGGNAERDAFLNGAYYHCGLCNPKYPPYVSYPVTADANDPAGVASALQALSGQGVTTVYVEPALMDGPAWDAFAQNQMSFITTGSVQAPDALLGRQVANLRFDPAATLKAVWPDLMAGSLSGAVNATVNTQAVQPELLSDGRLRLVVETAAGLQDGAISPEIIPIQ